MGLLDLIKERRSIRDYENVDISYEKINELIEAARWAPSSGNLQNWYFIIVKDKEKINNIAEAADQEFIKKAPALLVVCSDDKIVEEVYGERGKMYAVQNVAAAIQNILLLATEKGMGTCWIGAFDEKKIKEILKIPEEISVHAIITLGISKEKPEAPKRKSLYEIVFYNEWGKKEYSSSIFPLLENLRFFTKK